MRSQGKGQGHYNNRGGRGQGSWFNSTEKKYTNNTTNNKDIKFYPNLKGQQQMYTYEKVLNIIIQHIQKKFDSRNFIVESLRSRMKKIFTELTLQLSESKVEQKPVIPEVPRMPARLMWRGNEDERD